MAEFALFALFGSAASFVSPELQSVESPQTPRDMLGVGWYPTVSSVAALALDWAQVGPADVFYELGCGDGRVAVQAAIRGAQVRPA